MNEHAQYMRLYDLHWVVGDPGLLCVYISGSQRGMYIPQGVCEGNQGVCKVARGIDRGYEKMCEVGLTKNRGIK